MSHTMSHGVSHGSSLTLCPGTEGWGGECAQGPVLTLSSQPSPPTLAVEGTPMSQPLLQGDIPAREQDSPAQTGTGDGRWLLWGFGGLDPPALLSSLLLPPL